MQLAIVAGVGILLAVALGALVARTALKPMRRFTSTTEALTGDPDLSHRLEETGRDELTRLARSFNRTLDALEASASAQRHLVADASHELRTPIASLRANIQVLEDADRLAPADLAALRADIITELDELTALVGDIVELARGTRPATRSTTSARPLVAALVDRFERRFPDLTFDARSSPPSSAASRADRSRGLQPARQREQVEPARRHDRGRARRRHPDRSATTAGLREAGLPHVFDRFYRAERRPRAPGSGLGLAIVRQAAESHGGLVEATNAPDGGGLVRVRFSAPA